jgi:hypothetical protein
VWEIDPATFQVVAKYPAGREIQHVVPSYDMRSLSLLLDVEGVHRRAIPHARSPAL